MGCILSAALERVFVQRQIPVPVLDALWQSAKNQPETRKRKFSRFFAIPNSVATVFAGLILKTCSD